MKIYNNCSIVFIVIVLSYLSSCEMKDEMLDLEAYSILPRNKEYFLHPLSYKWGSDTVNFKIKKVDLITSEKNFLNPMRFVYFATYSISYTSNLFNLNFNVDIEEYEKNKYGSLDMRYEIRDLNNNYTGLYFDLYEDNFEKESKYKLINYDYFKVVSKYKLNSSKDTIIDNKEGDRIYKLSNYSRKKLVLYNKKINIEDSIKSIKFKNWLLTKIEFKNSPPFELIR